MYIFRNTATYTIYCKWSYIPNYLKSKDSHFFNADLYTIESQRHAMVPNQCLNNSWTKSRYLILHAVHVPAAECCIIAAIP